MSIRIPMQLTPQPRQPSRDQAADSPAPPAQHTHATRTGKPGNCPGPHAQHAPSLGRLLPVTGPPSHAHSPLDPTTAAHSTTHALSPRPLSWPAPLPSHPTPVADAHADHARRHRDLALAPFTGRFKPVPHGLSTTTLEEPPTAHPCRHPTTPYHATPCHATPRHATPHHTLPYAIVQTHA
jgi:hypothetical protein